MGRRTSVFYCIFVILVLSGVLGYFIWDSYRLRHERVASFLIRGRQYSNSLTEVIDNGDGIEREVAQAENIIRKDPSIVAVQVDSYNKGLRLSVVKTQAEDYRKTMIAESPAFESVFDRFLYQKGFFDVESKSLEGGRISIVGILFTKSEIRYALMVLLFTVVGLLVLTLLIIALNSERNSSRNSPNRGKSQTADTSRRVNRGKDSRRGVREYSTGIGDYAEVDLDGLPESRQRMKRDSSSGSGFGKESIGITGAGMVADIIDEQKDDFIDLNESDNDFAIELDDDFDNINQDEAIEPQPKKDTVPAFTEGDFAENTAKKAELLEEENFDEAPLSFPASTNNESDILDLEEDDYLLAVHSIDRNELVRRLSLEIERASSFNQDLSFMIFHNGKENLQSIQEYYINHDLTFIVDEKQLAIIETDKDLDECISVAEDFLRSCEKTARNPGQHIRIGVSSRNGRLTDGKRLFKEALFSLRKTNEQSRIVAFRSDPEKYRQYLREKTNEQN